MNSSSRVVMAVLEFAVLFVIFASSPVIGGRLVHPLDLHPDVDSDNQLLTSGDNKLHRLAGEVNARPRRDHSTDHAPIAAAPFALDDSHQFARVRYSERVGSNVVFILTYDLSSFSFASVGSSILYRSTDGGRTFRNESSKFPPGTTLHFNILNHKDVVIFSDEARNMLYITTDEGETYTSHRVPVTTSTMQFHPTQSNWILGHNLGRTLFASMDSGATWSTISNQVLGSTDFSWGAPGVDWAEDTANDDDKVVLYYNTLKFPTQNIDNLYYIYRSSYSDGRFVSTVFSSEPHHNFILDEKYIFAARVVSESSNTVELLVSYNRGPFVVAKLPTFEDNFNYYVGSYRSAQAVVIVRHVTNVNNVYFSDETGTYYTLSLERIAITNGVVDLYQLSSINGTFIAQQLLATSTSVRTVITFDNGASWQPLVAPSLDANNNPINCQLPQCSLHFHMSSSSQYRQLALYSRTSAPGILVARGNYGSRLTDDSVDVYISRDGGLNWEQTLNGTWDVEAIDHGGLLIAALDSHNNATTAIKFSCDEGMSWYDFVYTDTSLIIRGIITEPGQTATQVLLFGNQRDDDSLWNIVMIDFATVFERDCVNSDYYNWTVSNGRIGGQLCLWGETRVIERRIPGVCCWNRREYERIISVTPCDCSREDFECEWGYRNNGNECVIDKDFSFTGRPTGSCVTGYRKIPGDSCVAGVSSDFLPTSGCVSAAQKSDNSVVVPIVATVIAVMVIGAIISLAIVLVLVLVYRRRKRVGDDTDMILSDSNPSISGVDPVRYSDLADEEKTKPDNY